MLGCSVSAKKIAKSLRCNFFFPVLVDDDEGVDSRDLVEVRIR